MQQQRQRRQRYVYVLLREDGGPVKVGSSLRPGDRRRALEAEADSRLHIYKIWPHPVAEIVEKAAHHFLLPNWREGEWFDVTPEAAADAVEAAIRAYAARDARTTAWYRGGCVGRRPRDIEWVPQIANRPGMRAARKAQAAGKD